MSLELMSDIKCFKKINKLVDYNDLLALAIARGLRRLY